MDTSEIISKALFTGGNRFKNTITCIERIAQSCNAVFCEEGIRIFESNSKGTELFQFNIYRDSIRNYEYSHDEEEYYFPFDFIKLNTFVKQIKKNYGVKLTLYKDKLNLQIERLSNDFGGELTVFPTEKTIKRIQPFYESPSDETILIDRADEVGKVFGEVTPSSVKYVKFQCYDKHIVIRGYDNLCKNPLTNSKLGRESDSTSKEPRDFNINASIIKSLSKIPNIAGDSDVEIILIDDHDNRGKVLCVHCNVGFLGNLTFYFRNDGGKEL